MINVGARFDDWITGRIADFSPDSRKAYIDIDPPRSTRLFRRISQHRRCGQCAGRGSACLEGPQQGELRRLAKWWSQIEEWKRVCCLDFKIPKRQLPQHALACLEELTKDHPKRYVTTKWPHQMWAAQFGLQRANCWMTSRATMGHIPHPSACRSSRRAGDQRGR